MKDYEIALMKERVNKMENLRINQNIKCPGVRKHLLRRIRNAESKLHS